MASTTLFATRDPDAAKNARFRFIALVPREHSTGGKRKLLGISKWGKRYLRKLFVQGARAVVQMRQKQTPGLSLLAGAILLTKAGPYGSNCIGHKMACSSWTVLANDQP